MAKLSMHTHFLYVRKISLLIHGFWVSCYHDPEMNQHNGDYCVYCQNKYQGTKLFFHTEILPGKRYFRKP